MKLEWVLMSWKVKVHPLAIRRIRMSVANRTSCLDTLANTLNGQMGVPICQIVKLFVKSNMIRAISHAMLMKR